MNLIIEVLLLIYFTTYEANTRQIAYHKSNPYAQRGVFTNLNAFLHGLSSNKRAIKDINLLALEDDWSKTNPGKRCVNLIGESCGNGGVPNAGDDSDWINGGDNPGKRSLNYFNEHNRPASGILPGKRCVNLIGESCGNGGVPNAGDDSDWINGGDNPGKRSLNYFNEHNRPASGILPGKRCVNLIGESCGNGGVPNAGDDSDWINGGDNPGKRSLNYFNEHNRPSTENLPGKRCITLSDESCGNGGVPDAGDDSDWINGEDNPGKRSLNYFNEHNRPSTKNLPGKRCITLSDESCGNGGVPDAGDDSDWINGGDNPGKRSFNYFNNLNHLAADILPEKRCVNLIGESCGNGGVPSAAIDDGWISNGNSPGKRTWPYPGSHNFPVTRVLPEKRCANLIGESCGNGGVPSAAVDDDWIHGGNSPGKRSLDQPNNGKTHEITPEKRCITLSDESCGNGGVPEAGDDSDWLNDGDNPGK